MINDNPWKTLMLILSGFRSSVIMLRWWCCLCTTVRHGCSSQGCSSYQCFLDLEWVHPEMPSCMKKNGGETCGLLSFVIQIEPPWLTPLLQHLRSMSWRNMSGYGDIMFRISVFGKRNLLIWMIWYDCREYLADVVFHGDILCLPLCHILKQVLFYHAAFM
jgi:hypothetical protein